MVRRVRNKCRVAARYEAIRDQAATNTVSKRHFCADEIDALMSLRMRRRLPQLR